MSVNQYITDLKSMLESAAHGERSGLIDSAASWLGVSRQTVYRELQQIGWTSGRKIRNDKRDSDYSKSEVFAVSNILRQSRRQSEKQLLSTESAINIALANGLLSKRISTGHALRLMRHHSVHPDQLARATPHQRLASKHPNHVWQIDSSVCVLYRLRNNGLGVMDADEFRAKKPTAFAKIENERVLRYVATDHYSGAFKVKYFLTPGESLRVFFEFMLWAFSVQPHSIMHGVPEILQMDQASGQMSSQLDHFWKGLGIRVLPHDVGSARVTGQVENAQNLIETGFEGLLAFKRIVDLSQLEEHANQWQMHFNSVKRHSRHGHTRFGAWQMIRAEQLRICPDPGICRTLVHTKPEPRLVRGDLFVSYAPKNFGSLQYRLAHLPFVRNGEQVQVVLNPYLAPAIYVLETLEDGSIKHHVVHPEKFNEGGFSALDTVIGDGYGRQRTGVIDQARQTMDEAAWGESEKREIAKKRRKGAVAFDGQIDPFAHINNDQLPAHIARKGSTLEIKATLEVQPLELITALEAVRAKLGRDITIPEADWLRAQAVEGVFAADQIAAFVAQIQEGKTEPAQERPRLRLVS
jgi:hypothetical protein